MSSARSIEPPRPCPECGGSMEQGFMLDVTQGARLQATWAEGVHERSHWTGTKMRGRAVYLVDTWRCTACGALRSYATDRKR